MLRFNSRNSKEHQQQCFISFFDPQQKNQKQQKVIIAWISLKKGKNIFYLHFGSKNQQDDYFKLRIQPKMMKQAYFFDNIFEADKGIGHIARIAQEGLIKEMVLLYTQVNNIQLCSFPVRLCQFKKLVLILSDIQQGLYRENKNIWDQKTENAHQEALRALFAGNHQLFINILSRHNIARFHQPVYKVLAECLNIRESQVKQKYSKLFNQKFCQVLRNSEIEGRYFAKPEQLVLHSYAKYQYFEDKGRAKSDETVTETYMNIFKHVSNIDDFVYFIDFAVASVVRQPFELVEEKARQFLSGENQLQKDLEIFKLLENGGQQEKLIIEYSFCVVASNSSGKQEFSAMEKITDKVQSSLKNEPLKQLLAACLQLCPTNIIDDILERHPRELIQFDFKSNECRLNSQYLHPDLCGYSTFKTYFKKMNYLQQLVEKFQIIAHSAKVQEGKVFLGINYDLLGDDEITTDAKCMYNKKVTTKCISDFVDFLTLISTHISSDFIVIGEQRLNDKYYNMRYACKCFKVFATMNKLRTIRQHHHYEQTLLTWGRLFIKWSSIKQIRQQRYFSQAIQSYFSLIHSIQKQQEFQPLSNFQHQISKVIYELLLSIQIYPLQLSSFKGIKIVIFKWAMQNLPQSQEFRTIVSKFIKCFFDERLVVKPTHKEDIFQTPGLCKSIKKLISAEIIENVHLKTQKLQNLQINASWHNGVYQHSQFFTKLGYIISSRILDSVDVFVAQIVKLYHNYAHVWPILHSYRLWIIHVCKGHIGMKYEQKLQNLIQLWAALYQKLTDQAKQESVISSILMRKSTLELYEQFYVTANTFINSIFLKKIKDPISKDVLQTYLQFLIGLSQKIRGLFNQKEDVSINQWASKGFSISKGFHQIQEELLVNLRLWICNSLRFLTMAEEESIIKCLGEQLIKLTLNNVRSEATWKLICSIAGTNEMKSNSMLLNRQVVGSLQRYTTKLNLKLQSYVPFNFVSALYASIRSSYKLILKFIFTQLLKEQEKWQDLWDILDKILFTRVTISGSCIFNGQTFDKAKEDMALGIYYEQFQKLTELLTEGSDMSENIKIIVMLQKKKLFSNFYEILKKKSAKIDEKVPRANPSQLRYRARNNSPEEVLNAMAQMGITRQEAEIALEHIQYPDHNLAMQWIDNNQERIDQLILNRTLQRTRQQNRRQLRKQAQAIANQIVGLPFQRFYEKEKLIKLSRAWIKIIFKELFKEQNMDQSQTLKDLMFMFMDSLKSDQIQSQYTNLNGKLFNQIDQLNKHQEISNRLLLYLSILEGSFSKTEKTKNDFFQKSINLKILSYLSRIQNPILIQKIFSLINSTLPVFTSNDVISPQLQNYLSYLLDLVLKYRGNKKDFCEIMLKIAKSGRQVLMQRITRNLKVYFKENLIKQNMFSLINIMFETDKELSRVNAQLDLKTYLYQRYKHRLANFHSQKQHVLEIDIKQFQSSFPKYQKGSAIYEVAIGMLSKKKHKNKYFFFDCRKQKNAFDNSHYGKCSFLKYPIKQHFKTVIISLLTSLYEAKDTQLQEEIMTDLYKLLYNYRILLPFTIHQQINGQNLIGWLLFSENSSKRKFKFLVFLTLNSNLFIHKEGYQFYSLSDYVIARIITSLLRAKPKNTLWVSFATLYLSQVRRFSKLSEAYVSKEVQLNLIEHYQKKLQKASALQYINISQFLYIQYKRRIIDNLRGKYKFSSPVEAVFDRQFLNISPFFNSVAPKKENTEEPQVDLLENADEMEYEYEEQSPEMIDEEQYGNRFLRRRLNIVTQQPQYEQLIVPLSQQPLKQSQMKQQQAQNLMEAEKALQPIVIKNWQYLQEILQRFEKYLHFQEQLGIQAELKQAVLPQQPTILANLSNGFKFTVDQVNIDLDLKVKKLNGFQNRISQIYAVLAPKNIWDVVKKKEVGQDRVSFMNISRRLIQSLHNNGEPGQSRQALNTLQRLMQGRYHRQAVQNVPSRNLNINEIYQHLQQFAQPILPIIQQPIQERIAQQPASSQVQHQIQPSNRPQPMVIQPNNPQQIVSSSNSHQIQAEEVQPEMIQPQVQLDSLDNVPQDFQFEQYILGINQHIAIPQVTNSPHAISDSELNSANGVSGQNNFIPFRDLESQGNNPPPQEQNIQVVLQANTQQIAQQVQQPPIRQREILAMMGLPQTFLRDVNLDQEFFDSLPEELQQEQLLHFMSQQNANNRRNPNNSINGANQGQPDQTSQNLAFLESLDLQTRAQVLLEATPEFLATLPHNIRAEAQRYRHRQINRIIQQEEIEVDRNHRKNKVPLVYPVVKKEQFSMISDQAARDIFHGIFNIYPKLKLSALKVLLQNKSTQDKTLATIIALLRSLDLDFVYKSITIPKFTKVQWNGKKHKISKTVDWPNENLKQIRTYILHIILEHLTIPLYKDEQFLTRKIKYQVFCIEFINDQDLLEEAGEIDPIIELLGFSLSYYPQLATQLLKRAKTLPDKLFGKIVEGIRKQIWPLQLYDSLQNFSQNSILKEIFAKQFDSKPPNNKILSKLLKYKFAQLISLKKIHQDALQYYTPASIEFLNQIFCIYNIQNLNQIEPLLVKHKQINFEVIKYLVQNGREIEKEPIGIILKKPRLLDFQTKKFIFRSHPRLRRSGGRRVHIEVDRAHLFQGSYNQITNRSVRQLQGKIQVSFINEPGYDAGGLKRQWFLLVSREIFNQDYALFEKSSSGSTYQPNPKSYINPDHLNYFKFIGRFIAKALVQRELIDAYFTRAFYKTIIGQQLQFNDLQAQDYEFYKSMEWLKNNKIDQGIFTFSYIYDNFGNKIEKELVQGGKDIIVNQQNKKDYISKYCMAKMRDDFSTQVKKFLEGFYQVIPQECISYFEAKELQLLISGVPQVDIEDMKRNTDYTGYNPTDQIILWFWEIVAQYSQQDVAKLVQFITGTSKIPVQGFSHLIGMNGIQRISIHRDPCEHQLPKSHTCFNQLDLPNYQTKQILRQKLAICLAWGSQGFGFM